MFESSRKVGDTDYINMKTLYTIKQDTQKKSVSHLVKKVKVFYFVWKNL